MTGSGAMRRDVLLFISYRVVSRLYFQLPVLFLHLHMVQMGLYNTIALLVVYGLVTTVTATLGTALLRHMRQKAVVALGELMKGAGLFLVILGTGVGSTDFWTVMAAQVIGGTGFSLAISTDSSLLRTVTAAGGNDLFMRVQSRSQSLMFIATLVAGCIGSILYDYEAHWPFYAALATNLLSAALIFAIREEKAAPAAAGAPSAPVRLRPDPDQAFWMDFYALSRAFTMAPFVGFLPFFFIMLGVDPFLFGSVLGLFTMAGFIAALYCNAFLKRFGLNALMGVTIGCMLGSMWLFGFSDWFARQGVDYFLVGLAAIGLLGLGSGGVRPVTMGNIRMGALGPQERILLLSTMERNFGICNAVLLAAGGFLLVEYGFGTLMIALSAGYVMLIAGLLIKNSLLANKVNIPEGP